MKLFTLRRAASKGQVAAAKELLNRMRAVMPQDRWDVDAVLDLALQRGLAELAQLPLPGEHRAVQLPLPGERQAVQLPKKLEAIKLTPLPVPSSSDTFPETPTFSRGTAVVTAFEIPAKRTAR